MEPMNATPNLDPRAFDLSGLGTPPAPRTPASGSFVTSADDRTFESFVARSMQHPVVFEFTAAAAKADQLSSDLAALANEAGGRYLHVRVDLDRAPAVAQALGIQGIPMVVGVLGGQLAPLFQGTTDKETARRAIEELIKVATANGVVGRAQPVGPGSDAEASDPGVPDPRFEAADAALAEGDYARAEEEFKKLLDANPRDAEASAGIAQTRLLARLATGGEDAAFTIAQASVDPGDVEANLVAADLEVASGNLAGGFARLVELVRRTSGAERDGVRQRLLELFEAVGQSDPAVLSARRDLMAALF